MTRVAVGAGVALLAGAALAATMVGLSSFRPVDRWGRREPVIVAVPAGATALEVGRLLEQRGVIRSALAFAAVARFRGLDGSLKAGHYALSPSLTIPALLDELVNGRVLAKRITVPEGYGVQQVVELLAGLGFPRSEVLAAVADRRPVASWLPPEGAVRYPVEGYLFPDTYLLPYDVSAQQAVALMVERFRVVAGERDLERRAAAVGLTLHQLVTLASIVEREARFDGERPLIAAVYRNRLRAGMRLDADPTVLYALGRTGGRLYRSDLLVDSPYNTYLHQGLPPGPIASPGLASLEAVLSPADVPYLYFVAGPDGRHVFARTLAEHNRNVRNLVRAAP
ncbi:MAG: endolytic transglycosylase MltG [Clostridia bacterium]|nr:endolytic transglycosylase MltG [Clostridia bacterium]